MWSASLSKHRLAKHHQEQRGRDAQERADNQVQKHICSQFLQTFLSTQDDHLNFDLQSHLHEYE